MKTLLFFTSLLLLPLIAFSQPVNDECIDRILITAATGGANNYAYDLTDATESLDSSCENNVNDNLDVWYEFTMPVDGNVRISPGNGLDYVALYDSCGGAEIDCFNGDSFFYSLSSSTTYVLRMSRRSIYATSLSFDIEAFETATNDDCVNRTSITAAVGSSNNYAYDLRAATESTDSSCETASNENLDVWYEFTMPVNGNVRISPPGGLDNVALYDVCGGTELDCFSGDSFFYNLTSSTTYVLRMSRRSIYATSLSFDIEAFETIANDECTDRIAITAATGGANNYTYDLRAATESTDSSCESASNTNLDVWYEFVMPVNGNVRISPNGGLDNVALYDTCGGLEIDCFNGDSFFYDLTASTTYVLRMSRRSIYAASLSFNIEAFEVIANDDCTDRATITVSTGGSTNYAYDLRAATESTDSSCESASNTNLDVWYEFVMPVNGNVRISSIGGLDNVALYDSCGGTEIGCFSNNGFFYNLTASTTYVLRMSRRSIYATSLSFDIEAFETAPNDECVDALAIPVGVVAPINYSSDLRAASESIDASCNNASNINHDVWFEVEMPVDGNIQLTNVSNLNSLSLFDACGGVEISCFNNDGTFFNLTSGTIYYLRLSSRSIYANNYSFDIQAIESALPACTSTTEFIGGAWNNGVPDNTKNAIIRSNYNTSSAGLGSITACSCSIDIGTTLTIDSGDFLDVSFDITVDGNLNINHEGNVVQRDGISTTTNNGNINVHVTTPFLKPRDFMIMGSPMSAETREGVYSGAYRVFNHITGNFVPNADVTAGFPLAENFADDNNDNWDLHTGLLNVGEGYLVRPQSSNTDGNTTYNLTYDQGTLNNGDINFNVLFNTNKNDSPNMLSNPYPSAIFAGDFISNNSMIDEVYFWEHITPPSTGLPGANAMNFSMEDISMYNLMGGNKAANDPVGTTKPNGYISTSQGFGIKATAAGMATFTNKMRRTSNNNTLRDSDENRERIWLQISSPEYELKSTSLLGFTSEASSEIDTGFDSRRLATILSLYSHLEDGTNEFGIQSRETFNEDIKVPFGFSTMLDENVLYKISIAEVEGVNLSNSDVFLIDHQENTVTNLKNETYVFDASKGTFSNRFTIQFNEREILNISNNELNDIVVYPNPVSNTLNFRNTSNDEITEVTIFDLTGRIVKQIQVKENTVNYSINVSNLTSAMYILSVNSKKGLQNIRFIIE